MTPTTHDSESIHLQTLVSPVKGGTYTWRVADDILYADVYVANLFGVPVEDARRGLPLSRYLESIHPEDMDRVSKAISDAVETGVPYRAEYRVIDASGRIAHVLALGQCFIGKNENPGEYAGMIFELGANQLAEQNEQNMVEHCIAAFKAAKRAGNEMITYLLSMALIEIGETAAKQMAKEGTGTIVNKVTH